MKAKYLSIPRITGLLAGAMVLLSGARLSAVDTSQIDAFPKFDSYIKVTGQVASISGNGASFERRAQLPENGGGGIEAMHYARDFDDRSVVFDGKALSGLEDYLAKLSVTKSEFGSFEVGYKRFRTFYDGIGGFFPINNYWMPLNPENLHVDRGEFWVTAKLTLPDMPEIEIAYSNGTRSGQKDSTIWGRSDFTGLSNLNVPISTSRGMYPGYRDLDERHKVLKGSVKGTFGKTSYNVEVLNDRTDDNDTRYAVSYPGEIRRYPNPASGTLLPPENINNQQTITEVMGSKTNSWAVIGNADTEISSKVKMVVGISHDQLDADMTGDRPLVTSTPTAVGVVLDNDNNFQNLVGTATEKKTTGRLGFEFKPSESSFIKVMVKRENKEVSGDVSYNNVNTTVTATTGKTTTTTAVNRGYSDVKEDSWTPEVEVRYSGISRLALYANGTKKFVDGDERVASPSANPSLGVIQDVSEDRAKYAVGGVFDATSKVTLRGEVFYKDNSNHVAGYDSRVGDNYQVESQFTGVKLTAVVKPSAVITFTTRYVHQKGESQVTGYLPNFPAYDAMDQKIHSFGETIDWTPNTQFYAQLNVNVVFNVLGTIYPRAGITPRSGSNPQWNTNAVLQNADNNYVSGSFVAGTTLSKEDDLQFQASYYKADNFNADLAAVTMPYGASAREYSVTATLKHKFSDRMIGEFKAGYLESRNLTTGGNTDFHGPVGYISLNYAL